MLAKLPRELLLFVFSYLDTPAIVTLVDAFPRMSDIAAYFLQSRLHTMIATKFPDSDAFLRLLEVHEAVIGGSTALRFIYGHHCANWTPSTLDIYVGATNAHSLKCQSFFDDTDPRCCTLSSRRYQRVRIHRTWGMRCPAYFRSVFYDRNELPD